MTSQSQCRFNTLWISYQPSEMSFNNSYNFSSSSCQVAASNKKSCLNTRGAYVVKLSHSGDLIALACNQKYVADNSLVFMSPANGTICPVGLRNFGLSMDARGRSVIFHKFLVWREGPVKKLFFFQLGTQKKLILDLMSYDCSYKSPYSWWFYHSLINIYSKV